MGAGKISLTKQAILGGHIRLMAIYDKENPLWIRRIRSHTERNWSHDC